MKYSRKRIYLCTKDEATSTALPPIVQSELDLIPIQEPKQIQSVVDETPEQSEEDQSDDSDDENDIGAHKIGHVVNNKRLSNNKMKTMMKAPRILFKGHQLSVNCITTIKLPNHNDTFIFSGSDDKLIMLWSLKTGLKITELKGHTQRISNLLTFYGSNHEPYVISSSWDNRIRIWSVRELLDYYINTTEISNQQQQNSNNHKEMQAISYKVSKQSILLKGHKNRIFGLTIIPNNTHTTSNNTTTTTANNNTSSVLASGSIDNNIRIWSLPTGVLLYILHNNNNNYAWDICLTSLYIPCYKSTVLITSSKNNTISLWKYIHMSTTTPTTAIKSRRVAASPLLTITGHLSTVHSIVPFYYTEEAYIATACKDSDIRIWSLDTGIVYYIVYSIFYDLVCSIVYYIVFLNLYVIYIVVVYIAV